MTSIEDILFDGLIQTNNTTYDIELYFNTILEKLRNIYNYIII